MRSSNYKSSKQKPKIMYDARGMRVKQNTFAGRMKKALIFYLLPYFVINGIIFAVVTATPKIEIRVDDTDDYRTTKVEFTVKSLLPLKSLKADIESKEITFEKQGSNYTASVDMNGTFYVEAEGLNGMHASNYADVSVLDDRAPIVNGESCEVSGGDLRFTITDSQSGVNFDSIYGIYDGNREVRPLSYDRDTGVVMIPLYTNSLQIHAEDMVGNAMSISFSASAGDGSATVTEDSTGEAEAQEE
ncbi:MAG: hypothetical protein Q4C63_09305 [Eubacteriales bacterium]|nr:hypothetical protein [Eubacteriales bacterium]